MTDLRMVDGERFIFEGSLEVPALWGDGNRIAMAKGETLLIVAPAGVGKTTVLGQFTLRRLGVPLGPLLGMDVEPQGEDKFVLYVAADRHRQISRSMRRMVDPTSHGEYLKALKVHRGPLPFLLDHKPEALANLCIEQGVGTVVIDSLKDVCGNLADAEVGSNVNRALQWCSAAGIEVVVAHHQRKAQAENKKPRSLSDVYGSTWITAGAGSVVLLWGEPGDAIVELTHLKQPLDDIGPLTLRHDHDRGITTLLDQVDLLDLALRPDGITAKDGAVLVYGKPSPGRNEVEKIRRRLEHLVKGKKADKVQPPGANEACVYFAVREAREARVTPSREPSRDPHGPTRMGSRTLTTPTSPPFKGGVGQNVTVIGDQTYDPADDVELDTGERICLIELAESFAGSTWERAA